MVQVQASSFDKISPTAILVAYVREFTDILYSQQISKLVNAEAIVEEFEALVQLIRRVSLRTLKKACLFNLLCRLLVSYL